MSVTVVMPHMGESVVEGKIVSWLKEPGDAVEADEVIAEVTTDKVDVEIPAPQAGVLLQVLVDAGATVEVDAPIAVIGEAGEEAAPAPPAAKPSAPAPRAEPSPSAQTAPPSPPPVVPQPLPSEPAPPPRPAMAAPAPAPSARPAAEPKGGTAPVGKLAVLASPAVRRLARQLGVDLGQVTGTGRTGRIRKEDVLAFVEQQKAAQAPPASPTDEPPATEERQPDVDEELVPLTAMRKAIAAHMVRSKRESPHVTTIAEVDMTAVDALRKQHKAAYTEQGAKLTFMAFILNAVSRALHEFPDLNAQWTDKGILIKYRINIGVAVSVDDGLVVPVIRDVDRLSLIDLAKAIQSLAARTRSGKVAAAELSGGTFTITNPGVFGAVISTPIIHQPQAAILATGRIADVPAVVDGAICIRKHMFLSLSYDHRVVDGATAVKFLQRVRGILEGAEFEEM